MMKQVRLDEVAGKTVKASVEICYGEVTLIFADGTFLHLTACSAYENDLYVDDEMEMGPLYCALKEHAAVEAGIFSREEIDAAKDEQKRKSEAEKAEYERREYERLKAKFGE